MALVGGFVRILIFIFYTDVKGRTLGESQYRLATLEGFNLRQERVFLPVDPLERLFETKLRSPECFQLPLLPAVA